MASPALRRDGDDITDHELVARVRAGDDRAFEKLYTRYHRRIASYIQGMVHDHARAEDIAQDVFMSALRRMRETDRPIAFKPWVYEIAKNACIDQFRRARRAEEVSMDADEGLGSADYGRLVSSGPTPDVAVDHKQQIDHLRGAFGGLSETHHEILVMRELEGLSYREIGEKLGMTRPAVESTLFRARRRLTEEYDQLVTGERCVRVQQIITSAGGSALGARDRRRVARHVSYCQPCMRHARVSGIDAGDLVHTPVRQKIAALLPLPAFLKDRIAGTSEASATFAQWSTHASAVDPGLVASWGKAAATAATIAIAGVSAGVATNKEGMLPNSLGGVTLDSVTGKDNPGGSGDDVTQADGGGSGSGTGAGGAGSAAGSATAAGGNAGTASGSRRGGSTTTASEPGAGGSGPNASGGDGSGGSDTVGALAGAGAAAGGTGSDAPGGGDDGDRGGLLPDLGGGGSSGGGGGGGGGGNGNGNGNGNSSSGSDGPGLEAPQVQLPTVGSEPSSGGGGSNGNGNDKPEPGNAGGNGGGSDEGGSPVETIGEKSAEVIGGLVGG